MTLEELPKVYSLHRYEDEDGVPYRPYILSESDPDPEKGYIKHLNPDLMKIWENQSERVQGVVKFHLVRCEICRKKYGVEEVTKQGNL